MYSHHVNATIQKIEHNMFLGILVKIALICLIVIIIILGLTILSMAYMFE